MMHVAGVFETTDSEVSDKDDEGHFPTSGHLECSCLALQIYIREPI